ncbi:hypothetical protein PAXRUDRAFT_25134 [Paxillus rubicundulus Ve08.2h10]|uniref:Uncharacterized protein n=1 Tax=Paxillus rubicundulus Ve08.2h10 TaxID=930991 RepID=A0A0D0EA29_9AGAM|nr:hypothetical protein PAXRUDRAFT_25134 [Paxillus rubicundulus Ve08.2h10]
MHRDVSCRPMANYTIPQTQGQPLLSMLPAPSPHAQYPSLNLYHTFSHGMYHNTLTPYTGMNGTTINHFTNVGAGLYDYGTMGFLFSRAMEEVIVPPIQNQWNFLGLYIPPFRDLHVSAECSMAHLSVMTRDQTNIALDRSRLPAPPALASVEPFVNRMQKLPTTVKALMQESLTTVPQAPKQALSQKDMITQGHPHPVNAPQEIKGTTYKNGVCCSS